MRLAALVYSDALSRHVLRDSHPMRPARLRMTADLINAYGLIGPGKGQQIDPRPATDEEILWFHSPEYLQAIKDFSKGERLPEAIRYNFSPNGDNPYYQGMYEAAALSTGASVRAAELLLDGSHTVACNFSGGLHHAMPRYASGFCVFDDPVIAIKAFTNRRLKVAYVDIDCHHGDGVQYGFYDTDQVLTISLHESGRFLFPGTGDVDEIGTGRGRGYSVNLPLFPYTADDHYLWAFREVVPPLLRAFKPDVLVTQLGIDTHYKDPLTHLQLSVQGFGEVVSELGKESPGKWLALGGGGYDLAAVMRGWTLAFSTMADVSLPNDIPLTMQTAYGIRSLKDVDLPQRDLRQRSDALRFAEESVAAVKRTIFPFHGLSGLA